jgi:tripartite-type tricarboxylate transporter receptor subunit TctC
VEAFYKGRQVTVIISGGVGSTYDLGTRLITRHMARFIPGKPTMVPRAMPGGGHLVAANYLYNVAPKDGSTISSIGESVPMAPLLTPKKAKFDAGKFNWIGNSQITANTLMTWHTSGVRTLEDAKKREVNTGATGASSPSAQVPFILNNVLGTKFKVIMGYSSGQIEKAMESGELDARGSLTLGRLKSIRANWVKEKKVNLLFVVALKPDPAFASVPLLETFARSEAERRIFKFISSSSIVGRPILTPPEVPADRVAALRKSFDQTMQDKDFLAEAGKMKYDVIPVGGEELQAAVIEMANTPADVIALVKAASDPKGKFDCRAIVKNKSLCDRK